MAAYKNCVEVTTVCDIKGRKLDHIPFLENYFSSASISSTKRYSLLFSELQKIKNNCYRKSVTLIQ